MPYVPDPANVAEPISGRAAGTAAAEFRALKAVIAGLVLTAAGAPQVRQAVQSAVLDATGYNAALTVGAGLRPGLAATVDDPLHLNFAGGFIGGKPIDTPEVFSANVVDILGADLPLSNTSYLYRNYGVAWGSSLIPPQEGNTYDRTHAALLNFEGLNGALTTTDDNGSAWTLTNATISTAQFKFGTSCLDCSGGASKRATTTAITTFGDGSFEVAFWFRINALPGVGIAQQLITTPNAGGFGTSIALLNTAGTTKLTWWISSDGTSHNVQSAIGGTNTVWALNQWNKLRFVFDALAGTYKVYLSLNGALETTDLSVASANKVCTFATMAIGSDTVGGSPFNGWFDAFRFIRAATKTSAEVPVALAPTISDYPINFFNISKMTMYEVTAASAAANVNPTLAAKTRLFIGEADTSGAAVTAVRNYAIRGKYDSGFTATLPGAATHIVKSHNIGSKLTTISLKLKALTSEQGFIAGQEINTGIQMFDGANVRPAQLVNESRNTCGFTTGSVGLSVYNTTTGAGTSFTPAFWAYKLNAERSW